MSKACEDHVQALFVELKQLLNEDTKERLAKHQPFKFGNGVTTFILPLELDEYNEVYPNIIIGNGEVAQDLSKLRELKVTHVLNAAQGPKFAQINTNSEFYEAINVSFCGVPALDVTGFKISKYFTQADHFIRDAIDKQGKVYVHCHQGRSRSATLVIVYLMISMKMDLKTALATIRESRKIRPNDGFLRQLCALQMELNTV